MAHHKEIPLSMMYHLTLWCPPCACLWFRQIQVGFLTEISDEV